jgi:hypothetical protein
MKSADLMLKKKLDESLAEEEKESLLEKCLMS